MKKNARWCYYQKALKALFSNIVMAVVCVHDKNDQKPEGPVYATRLRYSVSVERSVSEF